MSTYIVCVCISLSVDLELKCFAFISRYLISLVVSECLHVHTFLVRLNSQKECLIAFMGEGGTLVPAFSIA